MKSSRQNRTHPELVQKNKGGSGSCSLTDSGVEKRLSKCSMYEQRSRGNLLSACSLPRSFSLCSICRHRVQGTYENKTLLAHGDIGLVHVSRAFGNRTTPWSGFSNGDTGEARWLPCMALAILATWSPPRSLWSTRQGLRGPRSLDTGGLLGGLYWWCLGIVMLG